MSAKASQLSPQTIQSETSRSAEVFASPAVGLSEVPSLSPETRKRNHEAIRAGFLALDRQGRCKPEAGVCGDAFQELAAKCGDPQLWTEQDMIRPEIHDLVLAYRTFGILHDNKGLIPDEQALLNRILSRQQVINSERDQIIRSGISMANCNEYGEQARLLVTNQLQVNDIRRILQEGILTERTHTIAGNSDTRWGEPGADMSAGLTTAVVRLYDYSLRETDKQRASMRFPDEPVSRRRTPEEQATLLAQILEELRRMKEKELEEIELRKKEAEALLEEQEQQVQQESEVAATDSKD